MAYLQFQTRLLPAQDAPDGPRPVPGRMAPAPLRRGAGAQHPRLAATQHLG